MAGSGIQGILQAGDPNNANYAKVLAQKNSQELIALHTCKYKEEACNYVTPENPPRNLIRYLFITLEVVTYTITKDMWIMMKPVSSSLCLTVKSNNS